MQVVIYPGVLSCYTLLSHGLIVIMIAFFSVFDITFILIIKSIATGTQEWL